MSYFWTEQTIHCSDGNFLIERTPVGAVPADFARYAVKVVLTFQERMPNGMVASVQRGTVATVPGATIEEAGAAMPQVIEDAKKSIAADYHNEKSKPKLAVPFSLSHQQKRKLVQA